MAEKRGKAMAGQPASDAMRTARRLIRLAATGSLATLGEDGAPFASLVTVAASAAGEPLLLLSDLALHTRNLTRDRRVSLLVVAPGGEGGDPLAGARLTVSGTIGRDDDEGNRRRFLIRHKAAADYSGFGDFHLYRIAVTGGHLVAGFGRILALDRDELIDGAGSG